VPRTGLTVYRSKTLVEKELYELYYLVTYLLTYLLTYLFRTGRDVGEVM